MKSVVTKLTPVAKPIPEIPADNIAAAVHHEVAPGCFLHIFLGAGGLRIFNGTDAVLVPLAVLVEVAQVVEPEFIPLTKSAGNAVTVC